MNTNWNPQKISVANTPLWAPEAVNHISNFLKNNLHSKVLEFGSGGSTVWLSQHDATVTSIEHNLEWFNAVQSAINMYNNTQLMHRNRPYFDVVNEFEDGYFDLVIVDGRDRNDCVASSLKKIRDGGLLVLDDAQRTRYKPARNLLETFQSVRYRHPSRHTQIWSIRHDID